MNIIHKIMDVQMSILECKTGATDLKILDTVIDYINQLEADKIEMAKIAVMATEQCNYCIECDEWRKFTEKKIKHKDYCTFLKAQQYIKEVEK